MISGFARRLQERRDELEWLYMELYDRRDMLDTLLERMGEAYRQREQSLRRLDAKREQDPNWFRSGKMLGMTMYTDLFAGNLPGLEKKLDYLTEQGITYLHLMPLLKMPHPDNDGGYAVEDFDQVDPTLGTNEDLSRRYAPPGYEPVPGFCHQPHGGHPPLGHAGQGGGTGIYRPVYLL